MVALGRHIGLPLPSGGSLIPMLFIGMGMGEEQSRVGSAHHFAAFSSEQDFGVQSTPLYITGDRLAQLPQFYRK